MSNFRPDSRDRTVHLAAGVEIWVPHPCFDLPDWVLIQVLGQAQEHASCNVTAIIAQVPTYNSPDSVNVKSKPPNTLYCSAGSPLPLPPYIPPYPSRLPTFALTFGQDASKQRIQKLRGPLASFSSSHQLAPDGSVYRVGYIVENQMEQTQR